MLESDPVCVAIKLPHGIGNGDSLSLRLLFDDAEIGLHEFKRVGGFEVVIGLGVCIPLMLAILAELALPQLVFLLLVFELLLYNFERLLLVRAPFDYTRCYLIEPVGLFIAVVQLLLYGVFGFLQGVAMVVFRVGIGLLACPCSTTNHLDHLDYDFFNYN